MLRWVLLTCTILVITPWACTQGVVLLEFSIDEDFGYNSGTPLAFNPVSDTSDLSFDVDISGLAPGVHTLLVRVKDVDGVWSHTQKQLFAVISTLPLPITALEYYFDTDPGVGAGTSISVTPSADIVDLPALIQTSGLTPGLHLLHLRSKSTVGEWSHTHSSVIYISDAAEPDIVSMEYYFDTDPGEGSGTSITVTPSTDISDMTTLIQTSGLDRGIHTLHVRSQSSTGKWSHTTNTTLYINDDSSTDVVSMEYYFDTDPGEGSGTSISVTPSTDIANRTALIQTSGLDKGVHTLYIRSKSSTGTWSHTSSTIVYVSNEVEADIVSMEYFFDTDPGEGLGTSISVTPSTDIANRTTQIQTSGLSEGVHLLHIRSKTATGEWSHTSVYRVYVSKTKVEDIVELEYFFGADPGEGSAIKIGVDTMSDIMSLPQLISTFALEKGVQILSIRSKDATGKWSHTSPVLKYVRDATEPDIVEGELFIGNDPGYGNGASLTFIPGTDILTGANISIANLSNNNHYVNVRFLDEDGTWSHNEIHRVKVRELATEDIVGGEYFFDTDPGLNMATTYDLMDATDIDSEVVLIMPGSLDPGEHDFFIRTYTSTGQWSHTHIIPDVEVDVVLPLTWNRFDIEKRENNALLEWEVSDMINVSHFEVEKWNESETFTSIGKVVADHALQTYNYTDRALVSGWNTYRIRQVDYDGAYTYSVKRSVYYESDIQLAIYPNPTLSYIQLTGLDADHVTTVAVFDNKGQQLSQYQVDTSYDTVDMSSYTAGVYYLVVTQEHVAKRFKVIKL